MAFLCLFLIVVVTSCVLVFVQTRLQSTDEIEHFSCGVKPFRNEKIPSPAYKIAFIFPIAEVVCILLALICFSFDKGLNAIVTLVILLPILVGIIYAWRSK